MSKKVFTLIMLVVIVFIFLDKLSYIKLLELTCFQLVGFRVSREIMKLPCIAGVSRAYQ